MIKEAIDLLGLEATDKVTGFSGIITSACFDLYDCVQMALTAKAKPDAEEVKHGHWFDVNRLEIGDTRVMPVPTFQAYDAKPTNYQQGAAPKAPPRI